MEKVQGFFEHFVVSNFMFSEKHQGFCGGGWAKTPLEPLRNDTTGD